MRAILILIILFVAGCNQLDLRNIQNKENQRKIAEAQTQRVVESLQNRPDWLFTDENCPADVIPHFEKEIKYMSEGCADNPDKCLEQCRDGDGNACYALALLLQDKHGLEQKDSDALFLRACKLGITSGCTNKAAAILNTEELNDSRTLCIANTFEKTCSKNDSWGCTMYGLMLSEGTGRKQNTAEAIKVLRKACDGFNDDDPACQRARELEETFKNTSKNASSSNSRP